MIIKLWGRPYNCVWIWFSKSNLKRCAIGHKNGGGFWWAILGFSGLVTIQSWPWEAPDNGGKD